MSRTYFQIFVVFAATACIGWAMWGIREDDLTSTDLYSLKGGLDCYRAVTAQRCNETKVINGTTYSCTAVSSYSLDPNSKNKPGTNVSYFLVAYCYIPNTSESCGTYVTGYANCPGTEFPGQFPGVID